MSTLVAARVGSFSVFSFSTVGSSGTFTDCANIMSIGMPSYTRGVTSVGNWGTTDYFDQFVQSGLIKAGDVSFTAIHLTTNSQQTSLIPEAMSNGTRIGWKVTVAGTSSNNVYYGDGFVTAYKVSDLSDDKVTFNATITITGKPVNASSTT